MTIEVQPYSLFAMLPHKIVPLTVCASILVLPEISFPNRLNLSPTDLYIVDTSDIYFVPDKD